MCHIQPPKGKMLHKGGLDVCDLWYPFQAEVLRELGSSLAHLTQFSGIVAKHRSMVETCRQCTQRSYDWGNTVRCPLDWEDPIDLTG